MVKHDQDLVLGGLCGTVNNVSEIRRWWDVWCRTGNICWVRDCNYTFSKQRVWIQDSGQTITWGYRCDIAGPIISDVQCQRTSANAMRINWCCNYKVIVYH